MLKYEDNAVARLNGNNLQPLSGVTVTVTDNATGLPASLYSDNGVTPINTPIVTNDDGYFSFYAPDGLYTLTFTSPRIAPITRQIALEDPRDNPYVTVAGLAAGTGAQGVGYNGRKLSDKLGEFVSVKDAPFNAKGDGVTDDTAAIVAAFLAAKGMGDGYQTPGARRVHFPNGVYHVSDTLPFYHGTYIDGESAGGVILKQADPTKSTLLYVDEATGVNQAATIKRIAINYPVASTTPGVYGIKLESSTAIAPVMEDVRVTRAWKGYNFALTINLSMINCNAINCTLDGFQFSDVAGMHNSAASIKACYAQGCGQYGFSGALIGSSLSGVSGDRCATGFSLELHNSALQGTTEGCTNLGGVFSGTSSTVQIYGVTANNALSGVYVFNAADIVFIAPKIEWGGGGTGYGLRVETATCERITVISPNIAAFGSSQQYNDTSKITFVGEFAPVIKSPDGTRYKLAVSNAGVVSATLA